MCVDQDNGSVRDLPRSCGQRFHPTIAETDKHAVR
jgi:hypothetical protein